MQLGETAVRWDGRELLASGRTARSTSAAALVIACGARPLGRAELGLAGDRPAGVVAAPSPATWPRTACSSAASRWWWAAGTGRCGPRASYSRPVPSGPPWSARTGCCANGPRTMPCTCASTTASCWSGQRSWVRTATLASGETLGCDAVVLAHGVAALRNVDGAVWTGRRTVYSQPLTDPATVEQARVAGAEAAAAIRSLIDQEERQ